MKKRFSILLLFMPGWIFALPGNDSAATIPHQQQGNAWLMTFVVAGLFLGGAYFFIRKSQKG
jgi:hypothetical protein